MYKNKRKNGDDVETTEVFCTTVDITPNSEKKEKVEEGLVKDLFSALAKRLGVSNEGK